MHPCSHSLAAAGGTFAAFLALAILASGYIGYTGYLRRLLGLGHLGERLHRLHRLPSPPSWPWPSWRAVTSVTSVTFAAFLALAILASAIRPPLRLDGLLLLLLVLARQRAEALELIDGLPQLLARELLLLGVKALRERVVPPAARKPCTSSPVGIGARSPTWKPTGRLSLDPSRKWS